MNKGELVNTISKKTGLTKKEIDIVLTTTLETIVEVVSSGEKMTFVGFGSFEARERKEKIGRNPRTGEKICIPASRIPTFSVGKFFKEKVNSVNL